MMDLSHHTCTRSGTGSFPHFGNRPKTMNHPSRCLHPHVASEVTEGALCRFWRISSGSLSASEVQDSANCPGARFDCASGCSTVRELPWYKRYHNVHIHSKIALPGWIALKRAGVVRSWVCGGFWGWIKSIGCRKGAPGASIVIRELGR